MLAGSDHLITEILVTIVVWIFIITGFIGIALGIGLIVSSARTLRLLQKSNRWISVRDTLKPMEKPYDIDTAIYRRRRLFGTAFAIGGAYTVLMLMFVVEFPYVVVALREYARPVIVEVLVDSLRWFLLLGGVLGIVIGVMMLVSTRALPALAVRLNQGYSLNKLTTRANKMHMTLDKLTEAYPKTTGILLAFFSMFALTAAMIVWAGR